jgi:hypothetical protein
MPREAYVDLLLNRQVRAGNGRVIGRIEEISADERDGQWCVTEYLLGAFVLLERLAGWSLGRAVLCALRLTRNGGGYRVRWDQMDLSDPEKPRLKCSVDELACLQESD